MRGPALADGGAQGRGKHSEYEQRYSSVALRDLFVCCATTCEKSEGR